MNRRRKSNDQTQIKKKKIIRCRTKMIPVFESDSCNDIIKKEHSDSDKICKNCMNSF